MEKEKDSKLKQAMKGLHSFLTTHYSFRLQPNNRTMRIS